MDVAWNPDNEFMFGSVSDDHFLNLYDIRLPTDRVVTGRMEVHNSEVNALAFNPFHDTLLATGAGDKSIALIDTRNLTEPLHVLQGHNAEIYMADRYIEISTTSMNSTFVSRSAGIRQGIHCWDQVEQIAVPWCGTFLELECHRQKRRKKMDPLNCFLSMEATHLVFLISLGTQMWIKEWLQPLLQKTTFSKFGKWPRAFTRTNEIIKQLS